MYKELSVLPKQNEQFSKDEIATTVMYVGHKPTTRREQIQQNWSIEVKKIKTSIPNKDSDCSTVAEKNSKNKLQDKKKNTTSDDDPDDEIPLRRSPRHKQNQRQQRSPRRRLGVMKYRPRRLSLQSVRRPSPQKESEKPSDCDDSDSSDATPAKKKLDFAASSEFDTPEMASKVVS